MRALFAFLALVLVAGCSSLGAPEREAAGQPPWQLISAEAAADERHLIVTVPLATPEAMAAVAARLEADYAVELVAEWPLASIEVHCLVFRAEDGAELAALERALFADPEVRTVQAMQRFSVLESDYADELFDLQSGFAEMNALKAHRLATGAGVRIAVVDTGVDESHPDLAGQVEVLRDFVGLPASPIPPERHGTAVAGIIAADARNGRGIVGIAPDARILALRGCWQDPAGGRCSSFSLARALNFVLLQEVDVLNLSLTGPHDPLLAELLDAALARGVVVVTAYDSARPDAFPASLTGVIRASVPGASSGSSPGLAAPVPAPGIDVITTVPQASYDFLSGSSLAAAHVSGAAALVLETAPELSPEQLRSALQAGVAADAASPDRAILDSCRIVATRRGETAAGSC